MFGAKVKHESRSRSSVKLNFYQSLIDRVFSPMRLGRLEMILPDGHKLHYGAEENRAPAVVRILDNNFFKRCVLFGDVGFGESYVAGEWETDDITKVIEWMILNVEDHPTLMADSSKKTPVNFLSVVNALQSLARQNTFHGSRKNISAHYDLGNNFFELFLDPTMTYSAAYFRTPDQSLADAQAVKYEELCQKLRLKSTDHVLEIGSGWGGFAIHAARRYGCRIKTVTISQEQFDFAKKRIEQEGLQQKIDIELVDYRHLRGKYDKIVSIEMIEAVGHKFLEAYFAQCHRLLKKDGLLALQMILSPDHRYDSFRKNVDWIQKYIFPGSLLPSQAAIHWALNKTGTLCLVDYEDITMHYVKTLTLWREQFNLNRDKVKTAGFDEEFIRKWNYYFCYCEAAFKMRNISVAQAVFSRPNNSSTLS